MWHTPYVDLLPLAHVLLPCCVPCCVLHTIIDLLAVPDFWHSRDTLSCSASTAQLPFLFCDISHSLRNILIDPFFWKGLGNSSAVGPDMVGQLASAFLDAMYKA